MANKRLDGWQWLFIVIAIISIPVVAIRAISLMPKKEDIYLRWASELQEIITAETNSAIEASEIRDQLIAGKSAKDILESIRARGSAVKEQGHGYKESFLAIEAAYKKKVEAVPIARWYWAGIGFSLWAGALIVLYMLGLVVGWVYRGFKH